MTTQWAAEVPEEYRSVPRTEPLTPQDIADDIRAAQASDTLRDYHTMWYQARHTWPMTRYRGRPILKAPNDLQMYHEILWSVRPSLVIETGSAFGTSALWFADQMAEWGGRVVSIDVTHPDDALEKHPEPWTVIRHERIRWITGSSIDPDTVRRVHDVTADRGACLVVLDSDHTEAHVRQELDLYAPFVTTGSYCVVEDTNISGRPLTAEDPGPGAAVDAWLPDHPEFVRNVLCERYLMTFHPGGWLARVG